MPWMFYGPQAGLANGGLSLMASVTLDSLRSFDSTQLATYGSSAIPLLGACLVQGGDTYNGLFIRKQAKAYGARRAIEGPIDRKKSVVVIDESISSGNSLYQAICALEREGLEVEGAICLVNFSGYGAVEWCSAKGYRVETVFDVWHDLGRSGSSTSDPPADPLAEYAKDVTALPDGLSPATVARRVAEAHLTRGEIPRPPKEFDRHYDNGGGTFVSIRRRSDDVRIARGGFNRWESRPSDPRADVLAATVSALRTVDRSQLRNLSELKFAVSFLGKAEPIGAGGIDHERHALVVRGNGPIDRVGFALPNAPHYDDEIQQYHYACTVTGRFWQPEARRLFRKVVERVVEPGVDWPPYGAPPVANHWTAQPGLADAVALRVQQILEAQHMGSSLPAAPSLEALDHSTDGIGVSLYSGGLIGCAISSASNLDAALKEATTAALGDQRYGARDDQRCPDRIVGVVSVLDERRHLGEMDPARLALFVRLGRDTLQATLGETTGIVLAHFPVEQSCTFDQYRAQVLSKAGISGGSAMWSAYETSSWLAKGGRGRRLHRGYPVSDERLDTLEQYSAMARAMSDFVVAHPCDDGLPPYEMDPWTGRRDPTGTATRVLIGLSGVLEAAPLVGPDTTSGAQAMIIRFIEESEPCSPRPSLSWDSGSDAQLLSALSFLPKNVAHRHATDILAARLRPLVRDDGSIYALSAPGRMSADLDFLSGSVLVALARTWPANPEAWDGIKLDRVLAFYRHRFRLSAPWGMTWWHAQAWAALHDAVDGARDFLFELADWALHRQSATSGAFVIDYMEPNRASFLTACVLEGIADAWTVALTVGDVARVDRYGTAWHSGMRFLQQLVVRPDDAFFAARPEEFTGGVRPTLVSSAVRIDMVGHTLIALAKGARNLAG